jgi:hypothetical protein
MLRCLNHVLEWKEMAASTKSDLLDLALGDATTAPSSFAANPDTFADLIKI